MCFSASASFMTFGITGAVGLAAVSRIRHPKELPLAAIPLVFAVQQALEGSLWLTLPVAPDGPVSSVFTYLFLLLAKAFWPIYASLAVLMIEPNQNRQWLQAACFAAGIGTAVYFLASIFSIPHTAIIQNGHIVYSGEDYGSESILAVVSGLLYMAATGITPVLSSHRIVALFGALVMVGSIVTYMFYWEAYTSVWCFFAAVGSVVILAHFELEQRAHQSALQT
jgi:hypothetical protein